MIRLWFCGKPVKYDGRVRNCCQTSVFCSIHDNFSARALTWVNTMVGARAGVAVDQDTAIML